MSAERLLGSYILRVSIHRNRWRLSVQDVRGGEARTFGSFQELLEHLEAEVSRAHSARPVAPKQRRP